MKSLCEKNILVTGGAGFIGSAFILMGLYKNLCKKIVNLDALTYAACVDNLSAVAEDPRYLFVHGNILDQQLVEGIIQEHQIDIIVHFAAESHVDRSIHGPNLFFETNAYGTLSLLEVLRRNIQVHLHHISTDEVFGPLGSEGVFDESSRYAPSSPYSASKAAADHFVRSYARTYGLSTTSAVSTASTAITTSSNNLHARAASQTHCISGLPFKDARTFLGKRVELSLAGITQAIFLLLYILFPRFFEFPAPKCALASIQVHKKASKDQGHSENHVLVYLIQNESRKETPLHHSQFVLPTLLIQA